jgi:NAD(P)-dependent dehydrogenase (short-subunit alcohol dehydrogenase family)
VGILTGNRPAHELDEETWATTLDVNLTAVWRMSRAVVPGMIARAQGGRIINIASVAGAIGTPNYGHYCASKHGVIGLTKTMAAELGIHNITVNAICPGLVDTKMVEHSTSEIAERAGITQDDAYGHFLSVHLIKERITPSQTAAAVMYLASDAARVVTGSKLMIDAGWSVT